MSDLGIRAFVDAIEEGSCYTSWITRTSAPKSFGARWADLSMGSGTPRYNTYIGDPLIARQQIGAGNSGIYTGQEPPAGKSKYLWKAMLACTSVTILPATFHLVDYLLYYPLVDGESLDVQVMDNTLPLPRYADGLGVRGVFIVATPQSASDTVVITYTNEKGETGRTTTVGVLFNAQIGAITCTNDTSGSARSQSPFFPLAPGDLGIRAIESVQFLGAVGGFMTILLCKPIGLTLNVHETGTAIERTFLMEKMGLPKIEPQASLNFLYFTAAGGVTNPLLGSLDFVWR